MDGKDIKTVVNVDEELDLGGEVAEDTTADSDNDGSPGFHETSGRSDCNETRDGT